MEVERGLVLASGQWYAVDRCETEDGMQVVPGSGMTLGDVLVGWCLSSAKGFSANQKVVFLFLFLILKSSVFFLAIDIMFKNFSPRLAPEDFLWFF